MAKKEVIAVIKKVRGILSLHADKPFARGCYGDLGLLLMKLEPKKEYEAVAQKEEK